MCDTEGLIPALGTCVKDCLTFVRRSQLKSGVRHFVVGTLRALPIDYRTLRPLLVSLFALSRSISFFGVELDGVRHSHISEYFKQISTWMLCRCFFILLFSYNQYQYLRSPTLFYRRNTLRHLGHRGAAISSHSPDRNLLLS